MADKIQLRAGNKSGMPVLTDREIAYVKDEESLYIGTPNGNKRLTAKPVAAQSGVAADADAATIAAALNALISAMKSSGVMNT